MADKPIKLTELHLRILRLCGGDREMMRFPTNRELRCVRALELAGLVKFIDEYPGYYETTTAGRAALAAHMKDK